MPYPYKCKVCNDEPNVSIYAAYRFDYENLKCVKHRTTKYVPLNGKQMNTK